MKSLNFNNQTRAI